MGNSPFGQKANTKIYSGFTDDSQVPRESDSQRQCRKTSVFQMSNENHGSKVPKVGQGVVEHITDRFDQVAFTKSTDDLLRRPLKHQQTEQRKTQSLRERATLSWNRGPSSQKSTRRGNVSTKLKNYDGGGDSDVRAAKPACIGRVHTAAWSRVDSRVNSCGTLFMESAVVKQNLEQAIERFGSALWELICHGHTKEDPVFDEIFDETIYPISRSIVVNIKAIPTEKQISTFIRCLFKSAQLCAECGIIALIYVHRLTGMAGITLHASNWKRVALGSIALASKVWDDQAVWNIDYCNILPAVKINDMNELERKFLLFIQFNVSVEPSLYAKYYFDLRKPMLDETSKMQPMDLDAARKMFSDTKEEEEAASRAKKRSKSAGELKFT